MCQTHLYEPVQTPACYVHSTVADPYIYHFIASSIFIAQIYEIFRIHSSRMVAE